MQDLPCRLRHRAQSADLPSCFGIRGEKEVQNKGGKGRKRTKAVDGRPLRMTIEVWLRIHHGHETALP